MKHANRLATRRTIRALKAGGRLEHADEAVVGMVLATAELFDEIIADPEERAYARAAIGRLHLAAVLALMGKEESDVDACLSEVISALSAPLGYAPEQPS